MAVSAELRSRLLEERGITPTEACDRCGQVLGPVRFIPSPENVEFGVRASAAALWRQRAE